MTLEVHPEWSREALIPIFHYAGFTRGAEIGVWRGAFSERLCQSLPGLQLTCVDPWQAYDAYQDKKNDQTVLEAAYEECRSRLAPYACAILRQPSIEAAISVPDGSLDFVFLDGNHAYDFVLADLRAWAPKVRQGGIVAGHDFLDAGKGGIAVKPAVEAFCREQGDGQHVIVLAHDKYPTFYWVVQ